jgi:hypothetical protein
MYRDNFHKSVAIANGTIIHALKTEQESYTTLAPLNYKLTTIFTVFMNSSKPLNQPNYLGKMRGILHFENLNIEKITRKSCGNKN